jgi:hypothetical protein
MSNAVHEAWELLANVSDGNWETQSSGWRTDTERWRDAYMGKSKHVGPVGFIKWPSTPRWHKGITITEKIDGTNACIRILDGTVTTQSRKRLITPEDDNFGFAKWAYDNAGALTDVLGYGVHFGEWFGEGIQKNPLGIEGKRFAHFSPWKYNEVEQERIRESGLVEFVPVLFEGQADYNVIPNIIEGLELYGSRVAGAKLVSQGYAHEPDEYARAEGIIVWHRETQQKYKILLDNDAVHKGQQ